MKDCLFLHMGPGFSAHVERVHLSSALPSVTFWDQPHFHGSDAYARLVDATIARFDELCSRSKNPPHLVAHSFGAQLALEIFRARPGKAGKSLFLGTLFNPANGFAHLLGKIGNRLSSEDQVRAQEILAKWPKQPSFADLMPVIDLLLKIPDFMASYWARSEARERHAKTSEGGPPFDFQQFLDTTQNFMARPVTPVPTPPAVSIWLGAQDPLVNISKESTAWRQLLPQADLVPIHDVGHFVHFELNNFSQRLEAFLNAP